MVRCFAPLALVVLLASCAGGGVPQEPMDPTEGSDTAASPQPLPSETTSASMPHPAPSSSATAVSAPPPAPLPTSVSVMDFDRLRTSPVRSLALGHDGHAATLEDEPWLFDGKGWKELPLPQAVKPPAGSTVHAEIFFGRDNRPRIMGSWTLGSDVGFLYLRYKNGWQEGHREIGSLANRPHNALFGVLGHDDPEVVCKVDGQCIIKRLTGWTIFQSGSEVPRVVVAQKSAWALYPDRIAEVGDKGWNALTPLPFQKPRGLWASPGKRLFVTADDSIFHQRNDSWVARESPVAQPTSLWGTTDSDVWVVGNDGAGHFDGQDWRKVAGVTGPLSNVLGRDDEVWLAGDAGVWRATGPRK